VKDEGVFLLVRSMDGCWDWVGVLEGRSDSFCGKLGHFLGFDSLKASHMLALF